MREVLIPAPLGGNKVLFVGNALVNLRSLLRNWAFSSAVAATLVFVILMSVTIYMRLYAFCFYLFPYILIGVITLFSFKTGHHASQLQGFLTKWYGKARTSPFVMDALETGLVVALVSTSFAACSAPWPPSGCTAFAARCAPRLTG